MITPDLVLSVFGTLPEAVTAFATPDLIAILLPNGHQALLGDQGDHLRATPPEPPPDKILILRQSICAFIALRNTQMPAATTSPDPTTWLTSHIRTLQPQRFPWLTTSARHVHLLPLGKEQRLKLAFHPNKGTWNAYVVSNRRLTLTPWTPAVPVPTTTTPTVTTPTVTTPTVTTPTVTTTTVTTTPTTEPELRRFVEHHLTLQALTPITPFNPPGEGDRDGIIIHLDQRLWLLPPPTRNPCP